MKHKKRIFLILIPVALVLIAGVGFAVFAYSYFPYEKIYRSALEAEETLPFSEAFDAVLEGAAALEGKPQFSEKRDALLARADALLEDYTADALERSKTLPYEEADRLLSETLDTLEQKPGTESQRTAIAERAETLCFDHAMDACDSLPYAEACVVLQSALKTFAGDAQRCDALNARLLTLRTEETVRAIDAGETAYALDLIRTFTPEQAEPLYQRLYDRADAMEAAGNRAEALSLFVSLESFSDAAERAEAIRAQIRFEEAEAVFTGCNYDEGIAALKALNTAEGDAAAEALVTSRVLRRASVRKLSEGLLCAGAWHTAWIENGAVRISGDARFSAAEASADRIYAGLCAVFGWKDGAVIPFGETFGAPETIAALTDVTDMGVGLNHALFLLKDGTVTGVGSRAFGKLDVSEWTDIVDVAAGAWHSVGVKTDGTALAIGNDAHGQCAVSEWTGVESVDAGLWHTVGLRADGTVVACGDNTYGQCDTQGWRNIVSIACGACFTVGLKADGTVVACGDNAAGQCDVNNWTEVAAIAAGAYHTTAVRMDGTLLSVGCVPNGTLPQTKAFDSDWTLAPITAISARDAAEQTPYIEGLDAEFGPWFYLDPHGAVLICIDDSEPRTPFRVDLLATADALPSGRVTKPDATGNIIRMPTEMVEDQAKKAHAVVAFTGDYLGFTSNRKGVMIRNGVVYYDRAETATLAIERDGTLGYYLKGETNAEALLKAGVKDSFSFGPLLTQDGKSLIDPSKDATFTMRVALGYSDPYHYLAVVTMRNRLRQYTHRMTAETMLHYGAKLAYNLDGGHSTSLVFMGKELSMLSFEGERYTTIRALSDIVMFLENPDV